MKALILSVGNEVLSGKTINTNASFIAIELEKIGVDVIKVVTIGDNKEMLISEVNSFKTSDIDILVSTGGLGPTHDDFTKEVLYEAIGLKLVQRKEPLDLLNKYFKGNYTECNLKQTYYPEDAYLIPNNRGTAMGAISEVDNKIYSILVGPPFEMKPMVTDHLVPYIKNKTNVQMVLKEFIVMGIGESQVEEILKDYYKKYPNVETNPYCSIGKVRYQINAKVQHIEEFNKAIREFVTILDKYIISDKNEEIEDKVFEELIRLNYHISFSESCTGGMLSSKMINVDGASKVIDRSLVTYSDDAKIELLGVNKATIDAYDIVSEEVAIEMAKGIKKYANSSVGVGVTGYAGPGGGTEDIPVGTVCFAICVDDIIFSKTCYYKTSRNVLRERVTMQIFYNLYDILKNYKINN